MAGRPQKILSEQDVIDLYEYLTGLDFLRVKEKKCLQMISNSGFKDLTDEQLKLARETQYLMNRAIKNFNLLHEIKSKEKHSSTETQIMELAEKDDIDSYYSMHDLLDALRKKTDAKYAENKIKQRITAQSKEKSPKKIADHKKYFLGSLLLSILEKRNPNLTDDMVMDSLIEMTEHEKFGCELNEYLKANQNDANQRLRSFRDDSFSKTIEIRNMIIEAKNNSRNPFSKK